jgi:tetratricopeptide (TPR) repeat protein
MVWLALLVAATAIAALDHPRPVRWLAVGIASGLAALARPNLALVGTLCVAWAAVSQRDRPLAARAGWIAAFALGALICIAPVTWRNYAVSGDFVPITYSGGLNLFLGNNPDANGTFRVPRLFPRSAADDPWEQRAAFEQLAEHSLGRELAPSEVSHFWSTQALAFAREYPRLEAQLLWHKLELATNAFEPWNIRSAVLARESSAVLRLPLVEFGWVAPVALAGVLLTLARWRELVPLYAVLATVLATLVAFFVLARYRIPAVPVLELFACAGISEAAVRLRASAPRAVVLAGLAVALAGVWSHRPLERDDLSIAYYNLGNRYRELADWPRAIDNYRRVIEARPNFVSAHNNLALVYEASGDHDALARTTWEHVRELGAAQGLPRYVERAERHLRALAVFPEQPKQ